MPHRLAAATLAVAALLAGLHLRYWRMSPDEVSYVKYGMDFIAAREVGRRIAETTAPGEVVYEWGAETNLYLDSRRDAASRYFYLYPLFVGTEIERRARMDALLADLASAPPAVFVWNRGYGMPEERVRAWLAEGYVAVENVLDFEIYRPRPPGARPPSAAAASSAASAPSETAAPMRNDDGR